MVARGSPIRFLEICQAKVEGSSPLFLDFLPFDPISWWRILVGNFLCLFGAGNGPRKGGWATILRVFGTNSVFIVIHSVPQNHTNNSCHLLSFIGVSLQPGSLATQ